MKDLLRKMDLQLFADDNSGNDDNDDSQDSSTSDVNNDDNNNGNQEGNDDKTIPYWRFKEVNEEKKKLEKKVNELQESIENMDDPEEIKKEMKKETEKLESRNKEFLINSELKVEALKAGVREEAIDDFVKTADKEELEVKDGKVEGVKELIENAKENKSFYFNQQDDSSSGGSDFKNGDGPSDISDDEKSKLKKYFGIN